MKNKKKAIRWCIVIFVMFYLWQCISMRLTVRGTSFPEEECTLYYIVNADGMKGLGHSILMIVDEEGYGTVLSFNGMQRLLGESLLGKSGVGKMSIGTMTKEETEAFLLSGDLCIEGDQLTDNYDMALYRPITVQEYEMILEQAVPYLEAEEKFAVLYEKWILEENDAKKAEHQQKLEQMAQDNSLPLYQIYSNNCDHAVRKMISSVDMDMQKYMDHAWRITPNGNLKAFGKEAENWGGMALGKQSFGERSLMFLVSF